MGRLFLGFFLIGSSWCSFLEATIGSPKLLVLIIASDDLPVYVEDQAIWRSYMHLDPDHVESYFLKGDPHLTTSYEIDGDVIWVKTEENVTPGIINKTIGAMEALLPRIEREFDFVLRANLSSFFVFPNLLKFLQTCPKTGFFGSGGVTHWYGYGWNSWAQGSGILFSSDLITLLVENKGQLLNRIESHDDVVISDFLMEKQGYPLSSTDRVDLLSLADWHREQDSIPSNAYHFRVKNPIDSQRESQDLFIYEKLLQRFYP